MSRASHSPVRKLIRRSILLAFLFHAAILPGCKQDAQPVVVYVSADEYVARPILEAFTKETGIPVLMVGDTEATKTTGLVERIRAERDNAIADVFWSSEAFMTIQLANEGLLAAHESDTVDAWEATWKDPGHRWFGFSPRPRVLVFDPERMSPASIPDSLQELVEPEWSGQIVMADPRFGTTGGQLAALRSWYLQNGDEVGYETWVAGLVANDVDILPGGNAAVVEEVQSGRAMIGLTDADDVRAANRLGAQLVMKAVGPVESVGTFMMPNTVAIVTGSSNPDAGKLVDFLLSDTVARALAESVSGNIPIKPEIAREYPELSVSQPMKTDLNHAAENYVIAVNAIIEAIETRRRDDPS
tara:strand:- start:2042 stop:3115 length:1074 start_codon:yes stop_codon:yes gene_type:complete